jgi:hypothetical protein
MVMDLAPKVAIRPNLTPKPNLNPMFVAMLTKELATHLNHHQCMVDFAKIALVFAVCKHRLVEAEKLDRVGERRMDMLRDEIRAREA